MIEGDNNDDLVEQMMNNYNSDEPQSVMAQTPTETKPDISVEGKGTTKSGTRREKKVLAYAQDFVRDGHKGSHLPVDLEPLTFVVSDRMTRASGRYKTSGKRVVISGRLMEKSTWDDVKNTIRHELVHAWQHQNLEWPRKTRTGSKWTWHGPTFTQWEDKLDISVRADAPAEQEYNYEVHCPNCGMIGGYMRKCKTLKQIIKNGRRYCQECESNDLSVMKDGKEINAVVRL